MLPEVKELIFSRFLSDPNKIFECMCGEHITKASEIIKVINGEKEGTEHEQAMIDTLIRVAERVLRLRQKKETTNENPL